MADEQQIETVTIAQLPDLQLLVTSFIESSNADGKSGKATLNQLATFLAPYITAIGGSGFLATTGTVLPAASAGKFTIVGIGTFTQTTGGSITTTQPINILGSSSTTWSLVIGIPIDLTNYVTNTALSQALVPYATNNSVDTKITQTNATTDTKIGQALVAYATNNSVDTKITQSLTVTDQKIGQALVPYATNNSVDTKLGAYTPKVGNPTAYYGVYPTIAAALSAIPIANRTQGMTVGILVNGGEVVEYQWKTVLTDISLVPKNDVYTSWIAREYPSGSKKKHLGKFWTANADTVAGDIPGTSTKWEEDLVGYANIISANTAALSEKLNVTDATDVISTIGVASPVISTDAAARNYWLVNPLTQSGYLNILKIAVKTAGNVYVKRWIISSDGLKYLYQGQVIVPVLAGVNNITLSAIKNNIKFFAGDIVSLYSDGLMQVQLVNGSDAPWTPLRSTASLANTTADVTITGLTLSSANNLQVNLTFDNIALVLNTDSLVQDPALGGLYKPSSAESTKAVYDSVIDLKTLLNKRPILFGDPTLNTGTQTSDRAYFFVNTTPLGLFNKVSMIATSAGVLSLSRYRISTDGLTYEFKELVLNRSVVVGLNTFTIDGFIRFDEGDTLAAYSTGGLTFIAETEWSRVRGSSAVKSVTSNVALSALATSTGTATNMQINFEFLAFDGRETRYVGKRASFITDSIGLIPYPQDANVNESNIWWGLVLSYFGMVKANVSAIGGTAIASTGANPEFSFVRRITSMDLSATDILFIEGGMNDLGFRNTPLGTIDYNTALSGQSDALFIPALRKVIEFVETNYPTIEIKILSIPNRTLDQPTFPWKNATTNLFWTDFNASIKKIAEDYHKNYLDSSRYITYYNNNTYTADGVHPFVSGHALLGLSVINSMRPY